MPQEKAELSEREKLFMEEYNKEKSICQKLTTLQILERIDNINESILKFKAKHEAALSEKANRK